MIRFLFAAAALVTLSAAVAAPLPRLEGRVLLASCRQGECGWLRILGLARAGRVPQGELRRIALRRGTSIHRDGRLPRTPRAARVDWDRRARTDYVFCSIARPAYAFETGDGALIIHYLDLYELAGYQQASGRLYMRFCHDRSLTRRALHALGYRLGTRSEQVEDGRAQDLTRF